MADVHTRGIKTMLVQHEAAPKSYLPSKGEAGHDVMDKEADEYRPVTTTC